MSEKTRELAAALADAYGDDAKTVSAARFAGLTLDEAVEIQQLVLDALGATVPVVKVAITPDGIATVAPIIGALVVPSGGQLKVPARGLAGIEVEIAARLGRDITPEIAAGGPDAIMASIETLVCGIEVIGSRLDDRSKAGAFGGLADNSVTAGYVYGTEPWTRGTAVEGLEVEVFADGKQIYAGKAKHPFGGVLSPIRAYGLTPRDKFGALRAGMIVTTGTLCGVVAIPGPCTITARVGGGAAVSVTLA